jgi:D-alanyl-D-alanine carboxypeptidase/D-alanyl-D-alanine-endopeptidase (penicillin-binding protein 4)
VLTAWGLAKDSYTYRNGSGLFDANRFSARQLTQVSVAAYTDAAIRPEFLSQLATGGVDGTIQSRFAKAHTRRYVRAKTGTLNDVSALTGFVFDPNGNHPIAFSIILNNASGYISAARAFQEKLVTAIADFLH